MTIEPITVKKLHDQTGAGYLDAKKALEEANGNFENAIVRLRERGISISKKKAFRKTGEGVIGTYQHFNGRVGVMLEVNCESDSAAATDVFKELAHNLAMHTAAMNPLCISRKDLLPELVNREREIAETQARKDGKVESIIPTIIENKLEKFYRDNCLLDQPYFKEPEKSINDILVNHIALLRENITVKRFVRFEMGE
ncbi:MAG TPA: translation elongation factor Ts [Thermotogota bacterium]|nr:translation elongation factor Ts [Thermotogota bacterium]